LRRKKRGVILRRPLATGAKWTGSGGVKIKKKREKGTLWVVKVLLFGGPPAGPGVVGTKN